MSTKAFWIAHVVSRNIVPLGGVLLLGWGARNVLILYFVDTVLAMMVIFAGLGGAFLQSGDSSRRARFANGAGHVIPVTIVIVAVTLPFVLGGNFAWRNAIDDPALGIGILWQGIAALWSCRDLVRALRTSTPEKLHLERRFGLVLSRWLTMAFLAILGLDDWFGPAGSAVLVAVYVVLSIWVELAPHHFLAGTPDDIEAKATRKDSARSRDGSMRQRRRRKR